MPRSSAGDCEYCVAREKGRNLTLPRLTPYMNSGRPSGPLMRSVPTAWARAGGEAHRARRHAPRAAAAAVARERRIRGVTERKKRRSDVACLCSAKGRSVLGTFGAKGGNESQKRAWVVIVECERGGWAPPRRRGQVTTAGCLSGRTRRRPHASAPCHRRYSSPSFVHPQAQTGNLRRRRGRKVHPRGTSWGLRARERSRAGRESARAQRALGAAEGERRATDGNRLGRTRLPVLECAPFQLSTAGHGEGIGRGANRPSGDEESAPAWEARARGDDSASRRHRLRRRQPSPARASQPNRSER